MLSNVLFQRRCCYFISVLIILTLVIIYIGLEEKSYLKLEKYFRLSPALIFNSSSIQRAILVFYPAYQEEHYLPELRWLYRSWIEMIKYESDQWRTDLIIFTEQPSSSLHQLGCVLNQIRRNNHEPATCRVILYLRISSREIHSFTRQQTVFVNASTKDLFHLNFLRSILLYEHLKSYAYIDSVNIIAETYPIYGYYDVILKTDLDVFLTKPFANFLPPTSRTLVVGDGGYSTEFNTRRLRRIARDMGWQYHNFTNIGSTWYGSPYVAYRIANLTLDSMLYLSLNEFAHVEREQKLAALLWPDWHYGVLSMYGTHLAVNHLIASEKLDIRKDEQFFDHPTTNRNENDIENNNRLHLHCWHTDEQFSKFQFKRNKYNQIDPKTFINDTSPRGYAMRMALESRLLTLNELAQYLHRVNHEKSIEMKFSPSRRTHQTSSSIPG